MKSSLQLLYWTLTIIKLSTVHGAAITKTMCSHDPWSSELPLVLIGHDKLAVSTRSLRCDVVTAVSIQCVSVSTRSVQRHCGLQCCYLRQRRRYVFLPVFVCLSVCLSVSKITQKRVHGFV